MIDIVPEESLTVGPLTVAAPILNRVSFHNGDKLIGYFDFDARPATFSGDVDESAKLFVDAVLKIFDERRGGWPKLVNVP